MAGGFGGRAPARGRPVCRPHGHAASWRPLQHHHRQPSGSSYVRRPPSEGMQVGCAQPCTFFTDSSSGTG